MDATILKKLRERTGVSYSLCQKALRESNNDIEKAEKLLTQWGAEKVKEKVQRKTASGGIFSYIHHNFQIGSLVEITSETDFVANNNEFKILGHDIAMQIASLNPSTIEELLEQEFIKSPSKKIKDLINEANLKFGENIQIKRFVRWQVGENNYA